jgi:hypothetical protein
LSEKDILNCTDDVQDEEFDNLLEEPTPELHDEYVGAEVFLPTENDMVRARVLHRVRDGDNRPIGIRHHNPMLDSQEYELEFADGSKARANANLIAENLYSMVDEQGKVHNMFKGIIDQRFPVKRMVSFEGETAARSFTKDGELQVQWANDTTTWTPEKVRPN